MGLSSGSEISLEHFDKKQLLEKAAYFQNTTPTTCVMAKTGEDVAFATLAKNEFAREPLTESRRGSVLETTSGAVVDATTRQLSPPVDAGAIQFTPRRMFINILLLSFAFMLNSGSTWTSSIIVESVIQPLKPPNGTFVGNEGYLSRSVTYFLQLGSPLYSIVALRLFGLRFALLLGGAQAMLYCLVFVVYTVPWLVYLTAATLGIGQGIMWALQGMVIIQNSGSSHQSTRNVGIFWTIYSFCGFGGLYSTYVFSSLTDHDAANISKKTRQSIYGVLSFLAFMSAFLLALIKPKPYSTLKVDEKTTHGQDSRSLWHEVLHAPFRTLRNRDTLLLLIGPTLYTGTQLGFYIMVFPTSIGFTHQFGVAKAKMLMTLAVLVLSIGDIVAGLLVTTLNRYITRTTFILCAFVAHVVGYALTYVTLPADSPLAPTDSKPLIGPYPAVILVAGLLLGIADGLCNTLLYATLTDVCETNDLPVTADGEPLPGADPLEHGKRSGNAAPAFAMNNALQGVVSAVVLTYASVVYLTWHFVITLCIGVWGVACFVVVERNLARRRKNFTLSIVLPALHDKRRISC